MRPISLYYIIFRNKKRPFSLSSILPSQFFDSCPCHDSGSGVCYGVPFVSILKAKKPTRARLPRKKTMLMQPRYRFPQFLHLRRGKRPSKFLLDSCQPRYSRQPQGKNMKNLLDPKLIYNNIIKSKGIVLLFCSKMYLCRIQSCPTKCLRIYEKLSLRAGLLSKLGSMSPH
jgi:hypothetical protein